MDVVLRAGIYRRHDALETCAVSAKITTDEWLAELDRIAKSPQTPADGGLKFCEVWAVTRERLGWSQDRTRDWLRAEAAAGRMLVYRAKRVNVAGESGSVIVYRRVKGKGRAA